MYVKIKIRPDVSLTNITAKNAIFQDIEKMLSGVHTSSADFNDNYISLDDCVWEGTLPSSIEFLGARYTYDSIDSECAITIVKHHSEADSDYNFSRKVHLFSDYNGFGVRFRSGYNDSDIYGGDRPEANQLTSMIGNFTEMWPQRPDYFWASSVDDQEIRYDEIGEWHFFLTEEVFLCQVRQPADRRRSGFFGVIDLEVTQLDKIGYLAGQDSGRRYGDDFTGAHRLIDRLHSPQISFSGMHWFDGLPRAQYSTSNTGSVYLGMQGGYMSNGKFDERARGYGGDYTLINSSWQGDSTSRYIYMDPDPHTTMGYWGDSDNNDFFPILDVICSSMKSGRRDFSDGGQAYNRTPTRLNNLYSFALRNKMKSFFRTTDFLGNTGDTITIGGNQYYILNLHKTGRNDTDNINNSNQACYLIPKS